MYLLAPVPAHLLLHHPVVGQAVPVMKALQLHLLHFYKHTAAAVAAAAAAANCLSIIIHWV